MREEWNAARGVVCPNAPNRIDLEVNRRTRRSQLPFGAVVVFFVQKLKGASIMSEPINSGFPFSGMEDSEELDVSAIFGGGAPTDDVNPFDLPAVRTETPAAPPI